MKKYKSLILYFIKTFIILFLLSYPLNLYASEVDIYGYFEPQYAGISMDDYYQLTSNKLRIDIKSDYSEYVSFGANCNFIYYSGKTQWNLLDYIPDSVSGTVPASQNASYDMTYENDIILDNAYLKLSFKYTDITLGKQQISLGTGYAWNPTDVFNYKDMIDPTYEQPGHNAIRIGLPFKNRYSIVLIYEPEDDFENSGKLMRIKGGAGHFDYSLIGIEKERSLTDYTDFSTIVQKRKILGGDFAGELFKLGVWGEYAYNFIENDQDFYESVIGFDYTFVEGTYFMCEYYRNTSAETDYKDYDINDWLRFLTAETKALSRDQIYALLTYPVTDLITAGSSVISSLNDSSFALIPSIDYSMFEDVEMSIFLSFNLGKEGTTYDENLGNGAVARLRVYF